MSKINIQDKIVFKLTIGRDPSNDWVLNYPQISAKHAVIGVGSSETLYIVDLKSTNGTFVNGTRIEKTVFSIYDSIFLGSYKLPMTDLRAKIPGLKDAEDVKEIKVNFDFSEKDEVEITVGRDSDCEISIPQPNISNRHAKIRKKLNMFYITDLESMNGTYVNGKRLKPNTETAVTISDTVQFGSYVFKFDENFNFVRQGYIKVSADDLFFHVPDPINPKQKKILCQNISLTINPGEVVAIMGLSGSGKTVLMTILNGYIKPTSGNVIINDEINLHKNIEIVRNRIGYVPQDDIMHPELTVFEVLNYSLMLRHKDLSFDERKNIIESTCRKLGLITSRKNVLNTVVGSPSTKRGLSGGERKRVNIAIELLHDPQLLFLDEPTSGLSSVDSENLICEIQELAASKGVTIIMTIHQPSKEAFLRIDNLLLIDYGGYLAYYGKTRDAVSYFTSISKLPSKDINPADYVLKSLEAVSNPQKINKFYKESKIYNEFVVDRKSNTGEQTIIKEDSHKIQKDKISIIYQFYALLKRNISIKIKDKLNTLLLFIQAPVIAMFIIITFWNYNNDYKNQLEFAKTKYYFDIEYARIKEQAKQGVRIVINENDIKAKAKRLAAEDVKLIDASSVQGLAGIIFLLSAAAIWFGIINSCREIVSESAIIKRESMTALRIFPYAVSKVAVIMIISLFQTLILISLVYYFLDLSGNFFLYWFILFFTSVAATGVGLLISAIVQTQNAALTFVPIIIIPQVILGGLLRPFRFLIDLPFTNFISHFMLQKWSMQSLLIVESLKTNRIIEQILNIDATDSMQVVTFFKTNLLNIFYVVDDVTISIEHLSFPLSIIGLFFIVSFVLVCIIMKRKYR